ncbi:MAG: hypothetical protein NTY38_32570 [Acidobacteria bacterium]|nr:hypothetical protein [Acidobacteriota bacterium]
MVVFSLVFPVFSQQRVDPRNTYERLIAIVPMMGAGTFTDPVRPLYAPVPGSEMAKQVIGFTFILSDDGKSALVEFVARDRSAFTEILNDRRVDTKIWQKSEARKDDVEKEFRKLRKDFDINSFGTRAH